MPQRFVPVRIASILLSLILTPLCAIEPEPQAGPPVRAEGERDDHPLADDARLGKLQGMRGRAESPARDQDPGALELRLAAGSFRPLEEAPPAPAWFRGTVMDRSARGLRYLVAVTNAPLDREQRRQIEAAGAELLDYLPVHGYRIRVAPDAEETVRALSFVIWLGELPAHLKVSPSLARRAESVARGGKGATANTIDQVLAGTPDSLSSHSLPSLDTDGGRTSSGGAAPFEAGRSPSDTPEPSAAASPPRDRRATVDSLRTGSASLAPRDPVSRPDAAAPGADDPSDPTGPGTGAPGEVRLRVVLFAGEPEGRVLELLRAAVITTGMDAGALPTTAGRTRSDLLQAAPSGKDGAWRLAAWIPAARLPDALSRLAALPEVEAIEPVHPWRYLNQDAVWVHQSFVGPSNQETPIFAQGIFGCGQIVGIADSGQDYDLCYFLDTINGPPPIVSCTTPPCPPAAPALNRRKDLLYYNWSGTPTGDDDVCPNPFGASGHGTHTSGSLAGDNATYANCTTFASPGRSGGDGLAPGARMIVQEMGDGLEYLNNLGGTLWNLTDVAYQNGARIHSNSWGGGCVDQSGQCLDGCTIPYDSFARDADLAMWTHPDLLLVIAAGNSGCSPPDSVSTPATAKNVVSVGAVRHGSSATIPSAFSSVGPVFDGRLKPTVAAQGEATVSAASDANPATNNCGTCSLNGTSMATPTAAGLAALVREYYSAGFYAAGVRSPGAGFTPSAALLKATLIDGALSATAPAPDFSVGYGRILLGPTLAFAGSPFALRVDDHEGITTGSVVAHAYDVAAGTPLRATLVWTDYPAALGAATARVNELKLEVIDPSGNVWFQTRDPGTGAPRQTSAPGDPHDSRNVEERLVFNAPAAGRWVVRVRGIDVPWGPQPFALVVRGALADCPAPPPPGPLTLTTPADHQIRVSWSAVGGAAAYNVYRSFGGCPGGPWVPVAGALAGTTFLDTAVSGGVTYSYYVTSASDAAGACESARSPCAAAVPTGDCNLAPSFRGLEGAASVGQSGCAVSLSWSPATPYCAGDARYNVYRSLSSGFTPGPANRIARCVIGTAYTDSVGLTGGSTYHYAVRAEDASSGHGGPCRGGNEEGNLVRLGVSPDGPPVIGTWSDDAGDTGAAKFSAGGSWGIDPAEGHTGPRVYKITSSAGLCADLVSPVLTLAGPEAGPTLSFWTKHDLFYNPVEKFGAEGSVGQVEIATGPSFGNWTRVPLDPDYPAEVDFLANICPTTQEMATYFSGTAPYTTKPYEASLLNWGGGDVRIRFHLSGDYLYDGGHWWIDDVTVTQAMVPGPCAASSAGPPPIPDGAAVPGVPLRASKSGANVVVTWDASRCPAAAVNLYRGPIGNFTTFTAGACNLPPTGTATLPLPANVWFLVAATDGASKDGSWGRRLDGTERAYAGASAACPAITQHVTNNGCP